MRWPVFGEVYEGNGDFDDLIEMKRKPAVASMLQLLSEQDVFAQSSAEGKVTSVLNVRSEMLNSMHINLSRSRAQ